MLCLQASFILFIPASSLSSIFHHIIKSRKLEDIIYALLIYFRLYLTFIILHLTDLSSLLSFFIPPSLYFFRSLTLSSFLSFFLYSFLSFSLTFFLTFFLLFSFILFFPSSPTHPAWSQYVSSIVTIVDQKQLDNFLHTYGWQSCNVLQLSRNIPWISIISSSRSADLGTILENHENGEI